MNKTIVAVAFSLVALAGCANKEAQVAGTWKFGSADLPPNLTAAQKQMADKMLANISIQFNKDKSFQDADTQGVWSIKDKTVSLLPTKIRGQDVNTVLSQIKASKRLTAEQKAKMEIELTKPKTATLSDDGKTLTLTGDQGTGSLTVIKQTGP